MEISVSCYSGYRGEETPRALRMGKNRIAVGEVLDRWLSPDHRYFKVLGDDGAVYIVRHDTASLSWELIYYKHADAAKAMAP